MLLQYKINAFQDTVDFISIDFCFCLYRLNFKQNKEIVLDENLIFIFLMYSNHL